MTNIKKGFLKKNVKVAIYCSTCNHEKYIAKALKSFLLQETSFNYAIYVKVDLSTDKTADIVRKYSSRYPDTIFFINPGINLFSSNVNVFLRNSFLPNQNAKYIALCEGDDFWTDKYKLQRQVDFLEKHPGHTICFHSATVKYESDKDRVDIIPNLEQITDFDLNSLIKTNFIPTSSVMYRNIGYSKISKENFIPGDWYLNIYHAAKGKIGFINRPMSVYYRHSKGIWFESLLDSDKLYIKHGLHNLTMFFETLKIFTSKQTSYSLVQQKILELIFEFARIDKKYQTNLVKQSIKKYTEEIIELVSRTISFMQIQKAIYEKNKMEQANKLLSQSLNKIQKAKFYKLWQTYCNIRKIVLGKIVT